MFARLGVFGTTAITAITAQNTTGIYRVSPVDPDMVRAQVEAVTSDLEPRAMKSGMLANAAIVHAVATAIRGYRPEAFAYVLDPVDGGQLGQGRFSNPMPLPQSARSCCHSRIW